MVLNSNRSNKKRVLFRADGNLEIGLGHVYRCFAIAERLRNHFDCYFAIRDPSVQLKNIISKSFTLIEINKYENYIVEAEYIVSSVIVDYKIDIITLDGYYFNTDYQKVIKEKCNSFLVSIDDDHPFHYVSDIVINHAGGIDANKISKESYTKLFLGYDYLLLRKEFIRLLNIPRKISGIHSVLVCFGGADPFDFTGKVIDCLKDQQDIRRIIIIIGASYIHAGKLTHSTAEYKHVEIKSNLNAEILAEIMSSTDLAIVPSSTIGLEAFASKMILITGMTADNQQNIYSGLIRENTVIGIGEFNKLTREKILSSLKTASKKYSDYTFKLESNINDSLLLAFKSMLN